MLRILKRRKSAKKGLFFPFEDPEHELGGTILKCLIIKTKPAKRLRYPLGFIKWWKIIFRPIGVVPLKFEGGGGIFEFFYSYISRDPPTVVISVI